jgi:nicotinate-nucleotide adenylyltransferase
MGSISNAEGRQPHRSSRVAFFGGSFDPPHLGHLAVARAAQTALGLDSVLFAPVGAQPLKPLGSTASFTHRLAMTRLAIASSPGFAISLADAPKPSGQPNYTLDTLLALRAELPPGSSLFCLMGADSLAGFRRWHRAAEIPFAAPLIVASRPGENLRDLKAWLPVGLEIEPAPDEPDQQQIELRRYLLRNPAGATTPFYLLPGLEIEISASEIRDQLQIRDQKMARDQSQTPAQPPERQLLPTPVSEYIRTHGLYL